MKKLFKTSIYYRSRKLAANLPKSKRSHQYSIEDAKRLQKKVTWISIILITTFFAGFLFYSSYFKIEIINIEGNYGAADREVLNLIANTLDKNKALILPQDNYFLLSKKYLKKEFQKIYLLSELEIVKDFPSTINITISEKTGQSILISNEQMYLIDPSGEAVRVIPANNLNESKISVIYDLSNTPIEVGQNALELKTLELINSIQISLRELNLSLIEIDYFKIDSPKVNYVKLVTKKGFEIHFNTLLPLEKQIYKLQKSLEAGKIDLNKILYINLRISDQVIYK